MELLFNYLIIEFITVQYVPSLSIRNLDCVFYISVNIPVVN